MLAYFLAWPWFNEIAQFIVSIFRSPVPPVRMVMAALYHSPCLVK